MRTLNTIHYIVLAATLWGGASAAQSADNLKALEGLAPVSALANTDAGKAALMANLAITGAIQTGLAHQPLLLPFADQQQQALRDASSTTGNGSQLADGFGSVLAAAYQALAGITGSDGSKAANVSPAVADVIAYAFRTTNSDAAVGKYFFANLTVNDHTPVSPPAGDIMRGVNGTPDVFGKAYGVLAGSNGAGRYGNARPFQTEPRVTTFDGKDLFGVALNSAAYLRGPQQDLTDSPSYPSGHTTYGYTEALLLAVLVPQRYPQVIARAAEFGNDRIVLGAHYAMDVLGGRTLATYDVAQLLANTVGYAGVDRGGLKIEDFRQAIAAARADMTKALEAGCGGTISVCAKRDQGRFANAAKTRAFYESTQTYGLPVVFAKNSSGTEDVAQIAPEAGYLLTVAFPYLSLAQADGILTATEGPGGGFLDNGSAFGVYSRLDLYRAGEAALAAAPAPKR